MASRTPQLRQSFLVTGAGVALVLVIAFATLSGNSAQRTAERQANDLGQVAAMRVGTLVDQYLRERRHEAEALAASPAVVRAAIEAAQQAAKEKLPPLDIPTLEQMFTQRRALGGDAGLAAYLSGYPQHSDYAELFFTERHGYTVLSSGRTRRRCRARSCPPARRCGRAGRKTSLSPCRRTTARGGSCSGSRRPPRTRGRAAPGRASSCGRCSCSARQWASWRSSAIASTSGSPSR